MAYLDGGLEPGDREALDFFEETVKLDQSASSPDEDAGAAGEK